MTEHAQDRSTAGTTARAARRPGFDEEDRAPVPMKIRVFIYLVAVHFISAFFFLLFYLGGAK
ncbi:hypothetical protein GCM10010218_03450 [Streptomyces mashuensis]|uniref:Small hydrophobic protein n=1 Tax=Streptomyces mashuensis TaxID=33904 RepID=A0A919AW56_9ACTN|nr:DUF6126 family protein [Streptomyces mashuensis]GHF26034.1 hypothetical protein GCM10010218_03450 [Streptomyces mashuensis]